MALYIPEYELKKPEVSLVDLSINQVLRAYFGGIPAKSLGTTLAGTLGLLGIVEVLINTLPELQRVS